MMSSMRNSAVQVPLPELPEFTCHCNPTIWLRVGVVEPLGLLKPENGAVIITGVAFNAMETAYAGY